MARRRFHVVHSSQSLALALSLSLSSLIAFWGEDDFGACRINAITGAPMSQFLGPRFKGRSLRRRRILFAFALAEKENVLFRPEENPLRICRPLLSSPPPKCTRSPPSRARVLVATPFQGFSPYVSKSRQLCPELFLTK